MRDLKVKHSKYIKKYNMKRFSNILFVTSTDIDDSAALHQAVVLANNNQAKLTVIDIVSEFDKVKYETSATELENMIVDSRRIELQKFVSREPSSGVSIDCKVLVGKRFIEVIHEVLLYQRDLVIKSAEPVGGIELLFGSEDMKLLRKCPCPLWIINSSQRDEYRQVMAAVAYSPEDTDTDALNGQILELAISTALANFAQLHIVHAWRLPHESFLRSGRLNNTDDEVDVMAGEEKEKRRLWLEALVDKHCTARAKETIDYLKPIIHLPQGLARNEVHRVASEIGVELVVMGTVGRSGIPGVLIGNTAETILQQIACSVLAVKPPGFVSPITL